MSTTLTPQKDYTQIPNPMCMLSLNFDKHMHGQQFPGMPYNCFIELLF